MDKQGQHVSNMEQVLKQLSDAVNDVGNLETPRKITPEEYYSSPEFQRRQKLAKEQRDREAFEKKVAFRAAQEQNPIKGKPRKKRGRKFRSQ